MANKLSKSFLRSRFGRTVLAWLFHKYTKLVYLTSRKHFPDKQRFLEMTAQDEPFITAFWHGRMFYMPYLTRMRRKDKDVYIMVSRHGDGALISRAMDFFGIKQVRGSSNRGKNKEGRGAKDRGGSQALLESVRLLENGDYIGITPDGPRGPRMRAQSGMVQMARLSGRPIVPATYSTTRCRIFRSWDRFMLPKLFGKATILVGEPVFIDKDADETVLEAIRLAIENQLNNLTGQADEMAENEVIQPA